MSLPQVLSYPPPTANDIPKARAPWHPDIERGVLLVHDVQEYFLRPYQRDADPIASVLFKIGQLCERCRRAGIPVVFSAQPGEQDRTERGLLWDMWGPGIISAPQLEGFVASLAPQEVDIVLHKRRYSAFFETDLQSIMNARGRDQIWITGVYGHIGCVATATDGFMRGIQPFLIADAIADFSRQDHLNALRQVARTCGVVVSTDQLLSTFSHGNRESTVSA